MNNYGLDNCGDSLNIGLHQVEMIHMEAIGCDCRFILGEERRGGVDLGETLIAPMGFHCLGNGSNARSDLTGKNTIRFLSPEVIPDQLFSL
jgi:hypothetical protein